jgi:hypothetical protein
VQLLPLWTASRTIAALSLSPGVRSLLRSLFLPGYPLQDAAYELPEVWIAAQRFGGGGACAWWCNEDTSFHKLPLLNNMCVLRFLYGFS